MKDDAVVAPAAAQPMRPPLSVVRDREEAAQGDLRAALDAASFLAETWKLFAGTLDRDETLRLAAKRAVAILGEACLIDLVEDDALYRRVVQIDERAVRRSGVAPVTTCAPNLDGVAGVAHAIRSGVRLVVTDDAAVPAAREDGAIADLRRSGFRSFAFLPLHYCSRVIGVMTVATRRGSFTKVAQQLLDVYAQPVALAIVNATSHQTQRLLREQAEAAKARLAFASRTSALFARSLDCEKTLIALTKMVTKTLADTALIFGVEEPAQRFRLIAASSADPALERAVGAFFSKALPQIDDRSAPARAARLARPQFFDVDLVDADPAVTWSKAHQDLFAVWSPVSAICLPLLVDRNVLGVLVLIRDRSQRGFCIEDVGAAEDLARRTATYIVNARMYEREHSIAATFQRALLAADLPVIRDALVAVRYSAGADGMDVGGDWYDVVEAGADRTVITIGDVIGRGVTAAAAMGQYRSILRAYAFEGAGPAESLARLNALLNAGCSEQFATCAIVALDHRTRRIFYASAGHPPPMLRLPEGDVILLDGAASMPVGAWPEITYTEATLDVPVGSTLLMYTDGLVETRRRGAADGIELLRTALARPWSEIDGLLDGVLDEVAPDRSDDVAMIAIEILPAESSNLARWAFPRLDRRTMRAIFERFDELLETRVAADSDTFSARLILGELLSNIVRHAQGGFRLELDWQTEYLELRVWDSGPGFRVRNDFTIPEDIFSLSGRGLFLVSKLSRSFRMSRRATGGLLTNVVLPVRRDLAQT